MNDDKQNIYESNWKTADALRGSVDGWDFKAYVFGAVFYRFLSESMTEYLNTQERKAGNAAFDYAALDDATAEEVRDDLIEEKGYFIAPSELFANVVARAPNDENLNITLSNIFKHIEDSALGTASEANFSGLFGDFDVNSAKLGATLKKKVEKLAELLISVDGMTFRAEDESLNAFGDAFEDLMARYAAGAGKSGGEFATPAEVSVLLAKIVTQGKTRLNKVYDPACGSGSLALKVGKAIGYGNVAQGFFGQEINLTTYNLCRMNMILHNIPYNKCDVFNDDTLVSPSPNHWNEEPFEAIVSNPPYSVKWKGDDDPLLINDPRYAPAAVLAPKSKADLAFVMHSLAWLAPSGTAALVCFPGVMYRGGAEQKIRKYLIVENTVDAVIQLPGNLFFGTSIATCVMVLKRGKRDNSVLFVDASKEFIKVTNNNKLTTENIEKIAGAVAERKNVEFFSRLAPYEEIVEQDFNLSVSTYVEQRDEREIVDIDKLNAEIDAIVEREDKLRAEIKKIIAEIGA